MSSPKSAASNNVRCAPDNLATLELGVALGELELGSTVIVARGKTASLLRSTAGRTSVSNDRSKIPGTGRHRLTCSGLRVAQCKARFTRACHTMVSWRRSAGDAVRLVDGRHRLHYGATRLLRSRSAVGCRRYRHHFNSVSVEVPYECCIVDDHCRLPPSW
jgi:hypothetical protein